MKREGEKRAQGTVEFMIVFAAILFFFIMFMAVIQKNISEKNEDKQKAFLQNVAVGVRDEISLAAESSEGYFREFDIPSTILGKSYSINITDSRVFVFMEDQSFSYRISNVTGNLKKGINNISRREGRIYVNE